jgi:hypothetical protein
MFRFSIRELPLLTVIIALAVGWALRERQESVALERWHGRLEFLKEIVEADGKTVGWDSSGVTVKGSNGRGGIHYYDGGKALPFKRALE